MYLRSTTSWTQQLYHGSALANFYNQNVREQTSNLRLLGSFSLFNGPLFFIQKLSLLYKVNKRNGKIFKGFGMPLNIFNRKVGIFPSSESLNQAGTGILRQALTKGTLFCWARVKSSNNALRSTRCSPFASPRLRWPEIEQREAQTQLCLGGRERVCGSRI